MSAAVEGILAGTAGLTIIAGIAVVLTLRRGPISPSHVAVRGAALSAVAALLVQGAHFAEELAGDFAIRFPAAVGVPAWPDAFFTAFNVFWLVVWGLAIAGLMARWRPALAPLWFLALAGMANGVAHPVLALRVGGYFPGLVTAPILGVAGLVLARRLLAVTEPVHEAAMGESAR
jgi:hypothetical protein